MPKSSRVTKMFLCRYVMMSEITIAYLCVLANKETNIWQYDVQNCNNGFLIMKHSIT